MYSNMCKKITVYALLIASTNTAMANQPNLNFVEVGFRQVDVSDIGFYEAKFNGINVAASFEIGKGFYIPLGAYSVGDNSESVDATLTELTAGIGYKFGVTSSSIITIDTNMLRAKVDLEINSSRNVSETVDGVLTRLMYHYKIRNGIQYNIGLQYRDLDSNEDDLDGLEGILGLMLHFNTNFAVKAEATYGFDENQVALSARYSF